MFKVCLCDCWQVQHLGARGQHFGPSPGPSLRGEVSWNLFRERQWDLTFFFFLFIVLLLISLFLLVSWWHFQSTEDQSAGLSQERSQTQKPRPAGNVILTSTYFITLFQSHGCLTFTSEMCVRKFPDPLSSSERIVLPQNDFLFSRTEHCRIFS